MTRIRLTVAVLILSVLCSWVSAPRAEQSLSPVVEAVGAVGMTVVDVRANDLVHWQTRLLTPGLDGAARSSVLGHFAPVSPGVIALPDAELGFQKGLLVRDPDGHALQLIAK